QIIGDDDPRADGWAIGVAGQVEEPAVRDAVAVEAGSITVRTVLPVDRRARQHELRVQWLEHVVAETPALERSPLEVLDDQVGERDHLLEELLSARLSQIERDRLLVPSLDRPEERVAVDERPDRAHEVALAGELDLPDLGTEVGEQRRRERRADARAD